MLSLKLTEKPTIDLTPAMSTASAISCAWCRFSPIGFSQKTCLPAPAQARAWSRWRKFGEEMTTASTSSRNSSYFATAVAPASSATARARSWSGSATATTSLRGHLW